MEEVVRGRVFWEVVPFLAMVSMEGCTIGLTILAKTAITYGMTTFVFVVYTNAVASILLLPYSFIFHFNDRTEYQYQQSLFTFPLLLRIILLGFTGICVSQNLAFLGLSYSSPIVVCAMGLMLPAISFILSILLRRTKVELKNPSFIIKVVGTVISVIGATSEDLYLGPVVRQHPSSYLHSLQFKKLLVFTSSTDRWMFGGLLLVAASLCVSIWNIIQLGVIKQYSQVMKVASFYNLVGTLLSAAMAFFVVDDKSAWRIKSKFDLFLIIATGIFSGLIRNRVQIWCMQMKGPYYVPMFKPFGILFATFFGATFFGDTFHYGSVMAAFIAGMGYLTVMWGQMNGDNHGARDEDKDDKSISDIDDDDHLSSAKVPLLDEESKV